MFINNFWFLRMCSNSLWWSKTQDTLLSNHVVVSLIFWFLVLFLLHGILFPSKDDKFLVFLQRPSANVILCGQPSLNQVLLISLPQAQLEAVCLCAVSIFFPLALGFYCRWMSEEKEGRGEGRGKREGVARRPDVGGTTVAIWNQGPFALHLSSEGVDGKKLWWNIHVL